MSLKNIQLTAMAFAAVLVTSCGGGSWDSYRGQLLGVQNRPQWTPINPYGMVYIPTGTLHIGPNDNDMNNSLTARAKQVSIQGFYMDETEVTNNEYRQFCYWVRDSIAHTIMEHYLVEENSEVQHIDWEVELDYGDPETQEALSEMYLDGENQFWGKREMDKGKWVYEWWWMDYKEAAKPNNRNKERKEFIMHEYTPVYPDTLVWVKDFTYSYNEPMTRNYFVHPAFDDYPVVGVNWHQANAFSCWRSRFWEGYRVKIGEPLMDPFRLPTEAEWEYAARGGKKLAQYPWGGPYVRNTKGCILANFKPGRGNYPEDGGFYTVRADAYWPNDYGLYNMAGNAAEWTSDAYYENAYAFVHDLNSAMSYNAEDDEPVTHKRKVLRGGSWKDIAYYIQCGTRHYEYADSAKSYIGFRNVMTFLGRDINDKN